MRCRHHAGDRRERACVPRPRPRGEQADRVGMAGVCKQFGGGRLLDDPAGVHHGHVVAGLGHHAEIVRDQQDRGAEPRAQVGQQIKNLRLDRDVERRRGLVGDHEIGLTGQRHRDHHPLPHSAGELVRILVEPALGVGHAHEPEHLQGPGPGGRRGDVAMQRHRLGDLGADREHGIQARHRLLEDHPDPAAADLPQGRLRQRHEIVGAAVAVEENSARLDHAGRRHEPQDRHRRHALAAAALSHEPERLPALDRQRHPIDGRHAAGRRMKRSHEILDVKQGHFVWRHSARPLGSPRREPKGIRVVCREWQPHSRRFRSGHCDSWEARGVSRREFAPRCRATGASSRLAPRAS